VPTTADLPKVCTAEDVGGVAMLIHAKSDRAARWYESYGALRLDDAPLSLVLPLAKVGNALKRGGESSSGPSWSPPANPDERVRAALVYWQAGGAAETGKRPKIER
jgi:hypothetical protein